MKSKNLFYLVVATIVLSSCATTSFYQVYKTTPGKQLNPNAKEVFFEDENCIISYNLWEDGGNIGFWFKNKTDENIYLKKDECFFVMNGISYNYFKNRLFTTNSNSGKVISKGNTISNSVSGINYLGLLLSDMKTGSSSVNYLSSSGSSVSVKEEKVICVPSRTMKYLSEYPINDIIYRDCDLLLYPTKKQIKSKRFTQTNSPFVFSNRITYRIGKNETFKTVENEFFINEITNYPESEIMETKEEEICGKESMNTIRIFKNASPNMFYCKYSKTYSSSKY